MVENYIEKTYAGWLGKIIGIRLGSPIEGWTYELIKKTYGEISDYLVDYKDYAADDDSNGPLFFIRAIIDYPYGIDEITEKEMGYTWLNYAPENHGFFWWGGYGISTEHTAYLNLKHGIDAPRSGSIEQNGLICAEQIGGQIFVDSWGFVAPGNPQLAADYARKMARVSHAGEGVYGAMFVAACVSAAYTEDTVIDIINQGLHVIPTTSIYSIVVKAVMNFYNNVDSNNWRDCYKYIHDNFGYDKYQGVCHIIPNIAVMILSMLYGEGDFSKTLCICNMCGWDTDCNAGNVGSILGVLVGIDNIDDKWIKPINDLLISSSIIGSLNISTVSKSVETFCELGYMIAGIEPEELWKERFRKDHYLLRFDLPKSTQAMRAKANESKVEVNVQNSNDKSDIGKRSLKILANRLANDSEVRIYYKTYYKPSDLHDSRYDPAFTPILYPNQTVKTCLYNDSGFNIHALIYVYDSNNDEIYKSDSVKIGSEWHEIEYQVPIIDGGLIKEAGIILYKDADTKINDKIMCVYMDYLEFSQAPQYNIDFSKECIENYGFGHSTLHKEISQFTYSNGLWELDKNYLSGSCCDEGQIYTGYYYLRDYEYECTLNPQIGYYHLINFRVQGAARSYAFGFYGDNQIALLKKHKNYEILEKQNFNYVNKRDYTIKVQIKGSTFKIYIDNEEVIFYDDKECSYDYGQFGLTVLNGSHCHYKDIKINKN
ncbi:hypothetical protein SH1V18_08930 [Vallitalea longa]|uniref:ADP-ribosylglycohydrolase n=1 Tax=Vallitalea longa TaxID=2936439 RepID=A0A9W6DEG0_9FIRM|nr:ADP-ribosylglycohydrolase family protein [Vallitalea longa]GKX28413.1 hypothetical protein SH1V18_08930 [Vallitalea longa]